MEQLAGYFDDSGSHDGAHACVVFGFVSTLEQWVKFELQWKALLALPQFDLEYLHMKEFRGWDGRSAKFRNDLGLQTQLFDLVQELGRRSALTSVNATVLTDAYTRVNAEYQLEEEFGSPLSFCAQKALYQIGQWSVQSNRTQDEMAYVFDQGMHKWGQVSNRVFDLAAVRPSTCNSREAPGLQLADYGAWESHRAVNAWATEGIENAKLRGSFRALMERFGNTDNWTISDESSLRELCESQRIQKRTT